MKALKDSKFTELVTKVTPPASDSILDHIWSNTSARIVNIVCPNICISDHLLFWEYVYTKGMVEKTECGVRSLSVGNFAVIFKQTPSFPLYGGMKWKTRSLSINFQTRRFGPYSWGIAYICTKLRMAETWEVESNIF